MNLFSSIVIGNESLCIQCSEVLLAHGHTIAAVVTRNPDVRTWALSKGLRVEAQDAGLADRLAGMRIDWIFSIANLVMIPDPVLSLASKGAVNFHDGPLPRYAGLNAPVWAILNREARHGITWHLITSGIDEGDILDQRMFDLAPNETALTLNTRCFEAAIDSFPHLLASLETGTLTRRAQDFTQRSVFSRADRPAAAGRIDFTQPAARVASLVRALDHGTYFNPVTCAKIVADGRILLVGDASVVAGTGTAGTVLSADEDGMVVACGADAVLLSRLTCQRGSPVSPMSIKTAFLTSATASEASAWATALAAVVRGEPAMRRALAGLDPADVPGSAPAVGAADWHHLPLGLDGLSGDRALAVLALGAARLSGKAICDLALGADPAAPILSDWVPLRVNTTGTLADDQAKVTAGILAARRTPSFAWDLRARDKALSGVTTPPVAVCHGDHPIKGTVVTLTADTLHFDATRLKPDAARCLADRLKTFAAVAATAAGAERTTELTILPNAERIHVLYTINQTAKPYDHSQCVHQAFELQANRTPNAIAVVCEGESLTYAALNGRANRAAHVLIEMGVRPGTLVGLCTRRSLDLLVGALAIQKAGAAYVPMDPAYPADRIALYIEDSACPVIVTQSALSATLPPHTAQILTLDSDPRLHTASAANPVSGVTSVDLAYMIYTSGSTGRPKGVMVEHRSVANFFAGMDDRIDHAQGGVWMAVTSLSFDISVLELFWTLARGFKIVLTSDENRTLLSAGTAVSARGMEFSLYYWGNDDGIGPKKYELLLDGARFADSHGFCAVWTPERHFHAFGGPYPNPSVTGAAVAAVTRNIAVRAGSCVAPLHHPARIAEEWAVIDNLTNGRAGMAIASGWHPDDFVLRPENTPPNNRAAMFTAIDQVRRLWRGETVEFPTTKGMFGLVTQPRPVSKELPIWVTTAGNPETWREAGQIGANVLTHLLGQTVEEVAGKIRLYHQALRDAGHDPATHSVSLMLHTYVARSRDQARVVAREPMKDYLRSAAGLIKQYAWAFPAFKKPQGVSNPMEIDLQSLSADETEAILDFAFQRYFDESGLFGTVGDCLDRVQQLKRIGVTEVACLIDYGIAPEVVLEGLYPLAEVLRRANSGGELAADHSIAAQIAYQGVTHLQCTPSMARMILMNDESRMALGRVRHLMLGGEALPEALVSELRRATSASIENMYGPTETTIWSSTESATAGEGEGLGVGVGVGVVNIGRPIANTQVYVLDDAQQPVAPGTPGELWIGGDGVARGYWQRDDLTADRFLPDPFRSQGRMYRTGDLVRLRPDDKLDFLGRADQQVKLRGFRIELGEIESVLEAQDGIRQAVVLAREDVPGDLRLVAYLVGNADQSSLRKDLASQLPEHMLPAHFVWLDSFPLTPNRKVDRKALPPPHAKAAAPDTFVAPEIGIEAQIAAIWARVLGVPKVGARDNFFALGGHSLLAVQAHREIRESLGTAKLSITDIFRFPTLSALAAHLGETPKAATTPASQGLADRADRRAEAMARRRSMRSGLADL